MHSIGYVCMSLKRLGSMLDLHSMFFFHVVQFNGCVVFITAYVLCVVKCAVVASKSCKINFYFSLVFDVIIRSR